MKLWIKQSAAFYLSALAFSALVIFIFILTMGVVYGAEVGIASFYGNGEPLNKYTASGEVFNPDDLTAASWYYDFGTMLKVTNLKNGKYVIIRVNDRGPNKRLNRAIDLSRAAFKQIAELREGLCEVKVEVICE